MMMQNFVKTQYEHKAQHTHTYTTHTQQALLPDRTLKEVVAHFYVWKQGDKYREWKADRPLQYVEQAIPDYHIEVCDVSIHSPREKHDDDDDDGNAGTHIHTHTHTHTIVYPTYIHTHTHTQSCERPGDLLCCDTCNLAFHMRCIGIDEDAVPDDFR